MLTVLSLGAGVQSTTLALMAARGEIEPPACAVFADTGWEPRSVYAHLEKLKAALPFPVHVVSGGNIRADIEAAHTTTEGRFPSVPFHLERVDGRRAMQRRQCTHHYKIAPVRKKVRELLAERGEKIATVWIGISTNEASRMKPSGVRFIQHAWPLIDAGMSRDDCVAWLAAAGWAAPKSACVGCPFRSNAQWRDLRDNSPEDWQDAIVVDRLIREGAKPRGVRLRQFMHHSAVPLDEAYLRQPIKRDLFTNECSGMCGT